MTSFGAPPQTVAVLETASGHRILVDADDFSRLSAYRWFVQASGGGGLRPFRRTPRPEGSKLVYLYRDLMEPPPGMVVDHINGDTLDNRRCNLRVCTRAENSRNGPARKRVTSVRSKGVHAAGKKFEARIMADGLSHYLGVFATEAEAASAYNTAAVALHGDYARLNEAPDA